MEAENDDDGFDCRSTKRRKLVNPEFRNVFAYDYTSNKNYGIREPARQARREKLSSEGQGDEVVLIRVDAGRFVKGISRVLLMDMKDAMLTPSSTTQRHFFNDTRIGKRASGAM